MNSGITYLETHPTRSVFRLAAVLLFVLILCLCVSLLTAYGLDIVIPLSFIVGFFLGILVTRHYRRSDLLGGSLGGAVGGAIGGFRVGFSASPHGDVLWALMMSVPMFLLGLGGGLILACVVVFASRIWKASKPSRRRFLTIFTVLAVIAGTVLIPWPYRDQAYSGDGSIEDTGFWSYPRYHVRLARISLMEPGEYIFRCSGLPPKPLTFALQFNRKSDYDFDVLSGLTTIVDVRLSTADGQTVGQASGALHEWVLSWTHATGAFWHLRLRDVRVQRNQEYMLTVLVKDVDSNSPPLEVQPTLSGGGNELP